VPKFTDEDDALLSELGIAVEAEKPSSRTPKEERIIAGFEDVQRFVEEHGRVPQHGEDRDIFERLYAVRLDRLRDQPHCRTLLEPSDHQGLLTSTNVPSISVDELDDAALLAELGVGGSGDDVTHLRFVRSGAEKKAAEEIANREKCADFETFRPLFDAIQHDLDIGARVARPFVKDAGFLKADITQGQFFVLGGQVAYVAEVGDTVKAPNGETDARLRVVYSNGTESNLLLRSLQRALYKDEGGRRITEPNAGPLFADTSDNDDLASGIIYVLRSKSDVPFVAQNRDLLHKIGVTGGDVHQRLANAKLDATFLLADVEIVASYKLFNINRRKLEALIHRVFSPAQLDVTIPDRFGNPIVPREWFLVPLFVIDEAVKHIKAGTITAYRYDPRQARLVQERAS